MSNLPYMGHTFFVKSLINTPTVPGWDGVGQYIDRCINTIVDKNSGTSL